MNKVYVIGAGLAGCEAAWHIAKHNIFVTLFEMKPKNFSKAHKLEGFAELVCSNSFKSKNIYKASGMLKKEMEILDSLTLECAKKTAVGAGEALAVDRNAFSAEVTKNIKNNKYIDIIYKEVNSIPTDGKVIVATGPLTSTLMLDCIKKTIAAENLYFYDAIAPIVFGSSIDMDIAFFSSRYDNENKDYLNCPMNKEQYDIFYENLISAELAATRDFDKPKIYEGCMPIEVLAKRGKDTMRFGPLKPVGIKNIKTNEKYYAIVQLRKENLKSEFFNMVGFQTNLKYSEQKRVFRLIPGLKKVEFLRYGTMHKNIFINSPKCLDKDLTLKSNENIYFAGQITGVEGYMESAACGILAGMFLVQKFLYNKKPTLPNSSIMASLLNYITNENNSENFQPMSANFGILPYPNNHIKNKKEKHKIIAEKGILDIYNFKKTNSV